ncbi:DUF2846 domain-containing protein [Bradyrhizobium sp. I1.7.5]|uniref:DUF2846 domain-containing protein n=1 Tax=Bradyrhizobium sp. I1.7.5 TaxID=3156363 RepID=UPI003391FFA1
MGRIKSRVVAIALVVGTYGCAGFAALAEPARQPTAPARQAGLAAPAKQPAAQAKPTGSRNARLYFLREKGIFGAMGGMAASSEILIDGKSVGKVDMGTFFFVDRPPGVHKIASHMKMSMTDYEVEVPVEAGKTYYFGVGVQRTGAIGPGPPQPGLRRQQRPADPVLFAVQISLCGRGPVPPGAGRRRCGDRETEAAVSVPGSFAGRGGLPRN